MSNTLVSIMTRMLSAIQSGQYLDGRPLVLPARVRILLLLLLIEASGQCLAIDLLRQSVPCNKEYIQYQRGNKNFTTIHHFKCCSPTYCYFSMPSYYTFVLKSRMYERFKLGLFFQKFFIMLSYFFIFKRAIKCYVGLSQSTWTPR